MEAAKARNWAVEPQGDKCSSYINPFMKNTAWVGYTFCTVLLLTALQNKNNPVFFLSLHADERYASGSK
jgi:hypothetical protein